MIQSEIKPTHRKREEIEAWFYSGQPSNKWPDWISNHFSESINPASIGRWALRGDKGYFWRWMDAPTFHNLYERIVP